jgi:hypothetical protein
MPSEERDEIAAYIRRFYYGSDAEKDFILPANGGKLNNTTISPNESKIVEQGAVLTQEVVQITGVPPSFLYELREEKYRNSVEQDGFPSFATTSIAVATPTPTPAAVAPTYSARAALKNRLEIVKFQSLRLPTVGGPSTHCQHEQQNLGQFVHFDPTTSA